MPLNGYLYSLLKLIAELDGIDSAETVAEAMLRTALEARPEIADLAKMRSDARKKVDAEWREKHGATVTLTKNGHPQA